MLEKRTRTQPESEARKNLRALTEMAQDPKRTQAERDEIMHEIAKHLPQGESDERSDEIE